MTMWQDKKNLHHYFITFLSQFDKKKFCDLHLFWRTPTQPFCLTNGHKETKMWWECDDSKLVLIFWSTSFENSRHYKTWCQMPDASMSMRVWAPPFWKERKEDFVMRNKQVSGAGQTGLKRKQNDDRVLQNFSRLIWWERAEETQKDTRK